MCSSGVGEDVHSLMLSSLTLLRTQLLVLCSQSVGDAKNFPQTFGFENLDPFLRVSKRGPCLTSAIEEDGDDERLVQFEFGFEADSFASPDPV